MIWASKDFFCPVGENFQKENRKFSGFSTRREKNSQFFMWKKQQKLSKKMNDVIVCVLFMNGG
jgi:hypothetical protein